MNIKNFRPEFAARPRRAHARAQRYTRCGTLAALTIGGKFRAQPLRDSFGDPLFVRMPLVARPLVAAGFVIGILNASGLGLALTLWLISLAHSNLWILLFITALVSLVLGMGMPTSAVYVLSPCSPRPAWCRPES
jgi:TRAP-type uncharacterized transport system fused permease subunit